MKSVNFKPDGRKILEVEWSPLGGNPNPLEKPQDIAPFPKATITVRFLEDRLTFNGRVDDTNVFAEGDNVAAIIQECREQLDALHNLVWEERLWVRCVCDELYHSHRGLHTTRVRIATTAFGSLWQLWSTRIKVRGMPPVPEWSDTRVGLPPTGDSGLYHPDRTVGFLCEPDSDVEVAVQQLREQIRAHIDILQDGLASLILGGADAVRNMKKASPGRELQKRLKAFGSA